MSYNSEIPSNREDPSVAIFRQLDLELKGELRDAPILSDYRGVLPDTALHVFAGAEDDKSGTEQLTFVRSPAPQLYEAANPLGWQEEWSLYDHAARSNLPVIMLGACLPDGSDYDEGLIKAGVPFAYRRLLQFRSGEFASELFEPPEGYAGDELPIPELLPMDELYRLHEEGKIVVSGLGGLARFHWRLPSAAYITNRVSEVILMPWTGKGPSEKILQ